MSNYKSLTAIANSVDFDTTFTNEYDQDQTGGNLIVPTSGTRLAIKGVYVTSEATTGYVRLTIDSNTVFTVYINSQAGYVPVIIRGLRNSPLKVSSTLGADKNYYILVNYREE